MKVSDICILATLIVAASPVESQQRVAIQSSTPERNASGAVAAKVTLDLDQVSLKQAINSLAAHTGIRIQYQGTLLDAVSSPVTVHAKDLPLDDVLAQVLAGTSFHAILLTKDLISIEPGIQGTIIDGTLMGRIVHAKTRQSVTGATVTIVGTERMTTSAPDGRFRLSMSPGQHTIQVRAVGYVSQAHSVTIPEGESVVLDILLEPTTKILDEIVVTGTVVATERKSITTPITVITAEDIEQRGVTRVEQLFRGEVPGVMALELGSEVFKPELGKMATAQVYVRGGSSLNTAQTNPLKVYVDGVEILDPSYLGTINVQSIERMEIIAGPQAATIYGSGAMGGVMQIFTRKGIGRSPEVTLALNYGALESNLSSGYAPSHRHTLMLANSRGPEFSYSGTLSYLYTGPWQPNLFSRSYGGSVGMSHVSGAFTASGSVSITSASNGTAYEYTPPYDAAKIAAGEWAVGGGLGLQGAQRRSKSFSQSASLNIEYRLSPHWNHRITIGRNQTDFEIDPIGAVYSKAADSLQINAGSSGARTSAGYNSTLFIPRYNILSQTITLGANVSVAKQMRVNGCTESDVATSYITCSTAPGLAVNKDRNDKSWGGFGSWRMGFFDQLFVTMGIRGERNVNYGKDYTIDWTPSMGAAWALDYGNVTAKFLASYGSATRPPAPNQRLEEWTIQSSWSPSKFLLRHAAPNLTPEYSKGPQAGIELYFGGVGHFAINRYVQKIYNLIQEVHADSILLTSLSNGLGRWRAIGQYQNVATIRQHGWELTSATSIMNFTLKGTYSWNDSRIESLSSKQLTATWHVGESFLQVPSHTANFTLGYAQGRTRVSLVSNYIGSLTKNTQDYVLFYEKSKSRTPMYLDIFKTSSAVVRHSSYIKSDLLASQQLTSRITVTFNMMNAGNSYGSQVAFRFPALGRQTNFGVRLGL